nr:hypothetical protein [Tanacetum cinerariifolium]
GRYTSDGSSFDEWRDYGVAGDDHEGPLMFDDDQFEDELEMGYDAFVLIGKEVAPNSKIPEAIMSLGEHEELRRQVEEFVSNGHIRKRMSTCAQPRGPLDLMSLHVSAYVPKKVHDFVEGLPYHGDSSDDDLVGNSRTNFYSFESMIAGRLFLVFVESTDPICYLVFLLHLLISEPDELEMGDDAFVLIGKEVAPNSEISEAMFPLLEEFLDVFLDELPDALPLLCNIQHHIDLEPGSRFPNMPHDRMSPGEHEELRRQVEEFVSNGHIRIAGTKMRIKQYLQMMNYALWDVIVNGLTLPKTQVVEGVTTLMPITSIEDKARRRLERNKEDLNTMSMDDYYNNLNVYDLEVKGMSSSNSSIQNMAFMSSSNNNNTNGEVNTPQAVNTALGVSTSGTQVNSATIDNLSDASNVECYNCHKRGNFAKEYGAPKSQDTKHKESKRRIVPMETHTSTTLVSCDGLVGYEWSNQAKEGPNYALMPYTSTSSDLKIVDNCKKGLGYESYNAVPPPYTGNFMPPKPNFSYIRLDEFAVKPVVENKSSEEKTKAIRKNPDAPIVKEWVSDDEKENMTQSKIVKKTFKPSIPKIEFVKPRQQE